MRSIAILLCLSSAVVAAPQEPQVSRNDGAALVAAARWAMREYILHRTAPQELASAGGQKFGRLSRDYVACVTLRGQSGELGRGWGSGGDVTGNVVLAALQAMRDPRLGERVTQASLDAAVVEVEVLGPPQAVPFEKLMATIVPGATGVRGCAGGHSATILPSDSYLEALTAAQVRLRAQRLVGDDDARWDVFASRHFVGYSADGTWQLVRGKLPLPPDAIDEPDIAAQTLRIGEYLLRRQTDGLYRSAAAQVQAPAASAPAASAPASGPAKTADLRAHCHAAYAMALLAADSARPGFADSAKAAIASGAAALKDATLDRNDTLAAAGWLVLASRQGLELDAAARKAVDELERSLAAAAMEAVRGQATSAPASGAAPLSPEALCVADRALQAGPLWADVREGMRAYAPAGDLWRLWRAWAHIPPASGEAGNFDELAPAGDWPGDQAGGWSLAAAAPTTELTALRVLQLRAKATRGGARAAPDEAKTIAAGRRFIYLMAFKQREVYFADAKDAAGGVRASAAWATVSIDACAWAIEALLAGGAN
jgi:AMMECR1 domain-containing protein